MPGVIDHIFVLLVLLWAPIDGVLERRRLQRSLDAGDEDARLAAYSRIMVWQWGIAIVLVLYWLLTHRTFDLLGMRWHLGTGFVVSAVSVIAMIAFLVRQGNSVRARPELAAQVREQAASLVFMLPSSPAELRRFTWLGITAGFVEELLCRGYIMWYLSAFVPSWVALALSSLLFALGHAYQGAGGVLKTGIVGVLLGSLYLVSGSLWLPILLHAATDVLQGRMIYDALRNGERPAVP